MLIRVPGAALFPQVVSYRREWATRAAARDRTQGRRKVVARNSDPAETHSVFAAYGEQFVTPGSLRDCVAYLHAGIRSWKSTRCGMGANQMVSFHREAARIGRVCPRNVVSRADASWLFAQLATRPYPAIRRAPQVIPELLAMSFTQPIISSCPESGSRCWCFKRPYNLLCVAPISR